MKIKTLNLYLKTLKTQNYNVQKNKSKYKKRHENDISKLKDSTNLYSLHS